MPPHRSLVGHVYGRLRVLRLAEIRNGCSWWQCECKCGNQIVVSVGNLQSKNTHSCGCLQHEQRVKMGRANRTHGDATQETPEYKAWAGMKMRCFNPNDSAFIDYGARGITVCDRWSSSFQNFLADMGRRPSDEHSLDRINNDGPYAPDNCRWATRSQQSSNRRKPSETHITRRKQCR
jgi:hypothetical protein